MQNFPHIVARCCSHKQLLLETKEVHFQVFVFGLFTCRNRGEVLNMGAHKEGAGAASPQPQEKENHLQLYNWFVLLCKHAKRSWICPLPD